MYFSWRGQSNPDDGNFLGVFTFLAVFTAITSSVVAIILGFGLLRYNKHIEQATLTRGTLIERVRIPNDRYEPNYYLRYKFDNPNSVQLCPLNVDTRTTPQNKLCSVTVGRVEVGQEAYKAATIPSKIEILYHSSETGTWSEPVEYNTHSRKTGMMFFTALLALLSGIFTWKSARVLWGSK